MLNNSTTILLIEDNPADVYLFKEMITNTDFNLIHVERINSALEKINSITTDAILLDLSLPDSSGLNSLKLLNEKAQAIPVVILTSLNDENTAIQAVQQGAQDYLIKGQFDKKQLVRSIKYAIERSKQLQKQMQNKIDVDSKLLQELKITRREKEILVLLANGKTNEEIAKALYLSLSTIKNHISMLFARLRISNRSQATAFAIKHGLIEEVLK